MGVAALVTTTVFDRRAGAADAATIWRPALRTTWQWQLTGSPIDTSLNVQMYDVDLFDTDPIVISTLHSQGRKAICYMSAGTWEDWRPDANQFPASVKGQGNGWEGEKWLDIRNLDVLGPIMEARMDLCKAKGFDGVEPDNVDGYANTTGFPLSNVDQMKFNTFLA
ncbi:MAG: endo alpha-1,4 polygalactosaminidase, partial [Acidobacteria bacterium]